MMTCTGLRLRSDSLCITELLYPVNEGKILCINGPDIFMAFLQAMVNIIHMSNKLKSFVIFFKVLK